MIVVNLFGGPSCGKTTGSFYIMGQLKLRGISCELAAEYAKEKRWERDEAVFENELYIFGKQSFRLSRLKDRVDVVVTDAPLLASVCYAEGYGDEYAQVVQQEFDKYTNLNYRLVRKFPYEQNGRNHTEEEAEEISNSIALLLSGVNHEVIDGDQHGFDLILKDIYARLHT